jgi:hypothetical protein
MKKLIDGSQSMLNNEESNRAELEKAYRTLLENFKTKAPQTGNRISRIQDNNQSEKFEEAIAKVKESYELSTRNLVVEAINCIASGSEIALGVDKSLDDKELIQSRQMAEQLFESFRYFSREREKAIGSLGILLMNHFISLGDNPDQFEKWWGNRCEELNRRWSEDRKQECKELRAGLQKEAKSCGIDGLIDLGPSHSNATGYAHSTTGSYIGNDKEMVDEETYNAFSQGGESPGATGWQDDITYFSDSDTGQTVGEAKRPQSHPSGGTANTCDSRADDALIENDANHGNASTNTITSTEVPEHGLPGGLSPDSQSGATPPVAGVNGTNAISSNGESWANIATQGDTKMEGTPSPDNPPNEGNTLAPRTDRETLHGQRSWQDSDQKTVQSTATESDTTMKDTSTPNDPSKERDDGTRATNEAPMHDKTNELGALNGGSQLQTATGSDTMMVDTLAEVQSPREETGAPLGTDQKMRNYERTAPQGRYGDGQLSRGAEADTTVEDASSGDKLPIGGDTTARVSVPRDRTGNGGAIESDIEVNASVETQLVAGGPDVSRSTDAGSPIMRNCGTGHNESIGPLKFQEGSAGHTGTWDEALQQQTQTDLNPPLPVYEIVEMSYGQSQQEPGTAPANPIQGSNYLQQPDQSSTNGGSQASATTESGSTQNTVAPVETQPLAKKDHASQSTDMGPQELVNSSIDAGQSVSTLQHSGTDRQDCPIPGPHTDTETPMHVDESIPSPMATSQTDLVTKEEGRRKRRRESLDGIEPSKATMGMTAGSKPVRRSKRLRGKEDAPSERVRKELAGRERVATRYLALCEKVLWDQERYFITWRCHEAVSESVYWAFGQESKEGPSKPSPYRKDFLTEVEALKFYEDNIQRVRDKKDMNYKEDKERMLDLE